MRDGKSILILTVLPLILQIAAGAENDYGTVRAWFNGENATVEGLHLKIGEPAEVKVEVISKINGQVFIKLKEPGVTKAFNVLNGPTKEDESIDNYDIMPGWSRIYTWTVAPNGAWKNGNAPINVFVQFSKKADDKIIQFTIANPYILDEQYTGAAPQPTGTAPGATAPKPAPFPWALGAIAMLIAIWARRCFQKG